MDTRELAKYIQYVDESEFTSTAHVDCIFDKEGIWVDVVYDQSDDESGLINNYQNCFSELYSDDEGNPDDEMWNFAKEVGDAIGEAYQLPVIYMDHREEN